MPLTSTRALERSGPPALTSRTASRSPAPRVAKSARSVSPEKSPGEKICQAAPAPPCRPALTKPVARETWGAGRTRLASAGSAASASIQTPEAAAGSAARGARTTADGPTGSALSRSMACTR